MRLREHFRFRTRFVDWVVTIAIALTFAVIATAEVRRARRDLAEAQQAASIRVSDQSARPTENKARKTALIGTQGVP